MTGLRVIVTGSRNWGDEYAVHRDLRDLREKHGPLTVVHGACPSGADFFVETFALAKTDVTVERHRADWKGRGPKGGPERNERMVALGADLVLAYIADCASPRCHRTDPHPSHGATGCADLADQAGIPVRRRFPVKEPTR